MSEIFVSGMNPPGTFGIYVAFDADKMDADEVRDALLANREAVTSAINTSLVQLMEKYETAFHVQIGGLPPGAEIQFFGPEGPPPGPP
jgi:hypothetical protein